MLAELFRSNANKLGRDEEIEIFTEEEAEAA
jgi:hypothetical protein